MLTFIYLFSNYRAPPLCQNYVEEAIGNKMRLVSDPSDLESRREKGE